MVVIPYLGEDAATAAGKLKEMTEDPGAYEPLYVPRKLLGTSPENCFAVNIRGASMTGAGISDGDIGIFKLAGEPENRKIMLVRHEDASTVKRLLKKNNVWHLCWEDGSGEEVAAQDVNFKALGELVLVLKSSSK
jgi:SOS-response transcriptional repressor LexA